MKTETTTDLILIEENMPLADIWTPENVDAMIARLEKYNDEFTGDTTTAKGRKEIVSFSRKYSTSKVLVDGTGKELVDGWKSQAKVVDAQRKRFREACDRLRDESRKPVTDFENAEKMVVANQKRTLIRLADLYSVAGDLSAEVYGAYIAEVSAIVIDGDILSDFYTRGNREKEQTLKSLNQKLTAKIQHDKDQAELAQHREEQEKRQKKEAVENEERERKAREKSIKAQAKKEATEKAAKKISDAKEATEKAEAEKIEAGEKAEREKVEAAAHAEQEKKEAIEDERRKTKEAAEQAEVDKKEWILREKERAEQRESDRLAKIEKERLADEKRANDKENRGRINNAILEYLVANFDISEGAADAIVGDLDEGKIPHTSVDY